jgi:hypothetical protein
MVNFVKKYPAISMFIVAEIIGGGMVAGIVAGVLPEIFFLLAAFGASLAGIILTAIVSGKEGLKKMFRRLFIWRVGVGWWAFAILALGIMYLVGLLLSTAVTGSPFELSLNQPLFMIFPMIIMQFFMDSGLGEELGWRGFLLPRIQARYNALISSIIVGMTWGLWHLPLFLVPSVPPLYEIAQVYGVVPSLLGFSIFFTVPWAILYTWLYNNTKGSLLIAGVFHAAQAWMALFMDPNDMVAPFLGYTVIMTLTAIAVVIISGPKNLSRKKERIILIDA